jgi:hypothetical protein
VGTVTVAELLERWYERTRYDLATTTRQTTEGAMRVLVEDFGAASVDALRPRHLDDWHTTRRAKGYSRAYSVRIMGVLSAACAWGIRRDLCETNPVASARQRREKGRKVKPPRPETVKAALALAQKTDPTLFLFLRIGAITGARRSEIWHWFRLQSFVAGGSRRQARRMRRVVTFRSARRWVSRCSFPRVAVPIVGAAGEVVAGRHRTCWGVDARNWIRVDSCGFVRQPPPGRSCDHVECHRHRARRRCSRRGSHTRITAADAAPHRVHRSAGMCAASR